MSFIIHQAIFGDKQGAYSLLDSSLDAETSKRICNVTDLFDRPYNGHLNAAIYRGFAFDDYYLFIKTFPDTDSGVRSGRVLSHALIVDINDLILCDDLGRIFEKHIEFANKEIKAGAFNYECSANKGAPAIKSGTRAACVINEFIHNDHVVWIGEEDYIETLISLWHGLPPTLRCKLKFGTAYDPKKINEKFINFQCIQEQDENRWANSKCSLINKNKIGKIDSLAAYYLVGDRDNTKELRATLETFNISVTSIEDLDVLINISNTYSNLANAQCNNIIYLCDLISKFSQDKNNGRKEKLIILNHLLKKMDSSSSKEILAIKNIDFSGFTNAEKIIGAQIDNWTSKNLLKPIIDSTTILYIDAIFDQECNTTWWRKSTLNGLKNSLLNWESSYATSIWDLFVAQNDLIEKLGHLIPIDPKIELDIVEQWLKPTDKLAQHIQTFALNRKWYILHGLTSLHLYSAEEAIIKQLEIDIDPVNISALNKMSELIPVEDFIQLAIKIGESRLVSILGRMATRNTSLMNKIDAKSAIWREVWLIAINNGNKPWAGIKKPYTVLFSLLEEILAGENISEDLLLAISASDHNDISRFDRRADVWQYLTGDIKIKFLNATSIEVVNKILLGNNIDHESIEKTLSDNILSHSFMEDFMDENKDNINTVTSFHNSSINTNDDFLPAFIEKYKSPISDAQAIALGTMVKEKEFRRSARSIYEKAKHNNTFNLAYDRCSDLVNFHWWEVGEIVNHKLALTTKQNHNYQVHEKHILPTVVVLTAIQEEYNAVRLHLKDIYDADQDDTNYEVGVFEYNGKLVANVIIRECGPQNTIASQETERAIQNFKPDCMFFVGIAGSRKPNDFSIGDVIFPTKIYSYEGGKSDKNSFKSRPDLSDMNYSLVELAKKERRKNDWKDLIKNKLEKDVKANLGIIASGEKLVEHYDSEIGAILTKHFNDTSAVEMEGFGFAKAATRQGREARKVMIGVVRGISDIIQQPEENQKESRTDRRPDNAKILASDTAAAFAFWLILKTYQ